MNTLLSSNDILETAPYILANEPDSQKRKGIKRAVAWLKEVRDRKLLCEFHGIRVFEYQGQRTIVLDDEMQATLSALEHHTSDSERELIEDLSCLALVGHGYNADNASPPPAPEYRDGCLSNGEDFYQSAAQLWAKTAPQRGLWAFVESRIGAKLRKLKTGPAKERRDYAEMLKRELAIVIDALASAKRKQPHGKSTLIPWPDNNGAREVTVAWAAFKLTCALILQDLRPPTKGDVRRVMKSRWPNLKMTDAAWGKVWKSAGLSWLGRKGDW